MYILYMRYGMYVLYMKNKRERYHFTYKLQNRILLFDHVKVPFPETQMQLRRDRAVDKGVKYEIIILPSRACFPAA